MSQYEVELKFPVADLAALRRQLIDRGARPLGIQQHRDTYYNHPCRDFAQTHEALRIRRVDDQPMITYKGAKLDSPVKTRIELEWALGAGDVDGSNTEAMLVHLGFRRVAEVAKQRESFAVQPEAPSSELTVTLDDVQRVGTFAEIECIAEADGIERAQEYVQAFAESLGLQNPEKRSYLRMLLQADG
ncbi:class IV adenylate cyclase [Rosistilla oblonga]|uniref:class IV adenylate cyclase n=1 Tax=Rosistilla oblonga TaxID=2527990 RepID=UPI003A9785D6